MFCLHAYTCYAICSQTSIALEGKHPRAHEVSVNLICKSYLPDVDKPYDENKATRFTFCWNFNL